MALGTQPWKPCAAPSPHGQLFGGPSGGFPTAVRAIADALRVTAELTKLSLGKNNLGEAGTKSICDALKGNKTLKELDLSGELSSNIGGAAGVKHVAELLVTLGTVAQGHHMTVRASCPAACPQA